ncbi:MAG: hypothetical protein IKS22_10160 [Bacteroidales bacterium]|nr:hypothetical protein [Bacteroidales bacterium]
MKYSIKTINALRRLRDGEVLGGGEFSSESAKELIERLTRRGAVLLNRVGKVRVRYRVLDKNFFLEECSVIDPVLSDLDSALKLAEGQVRERSEKVILFGDSKVDGASPTVKGFTLLSDRDTVVNYLGREYVVGPLAGIHVVDYTSLVIPPEATVVVVENAECLYDHRWIANTGLSLDEGPYLIMCRYPQSENGKKWLLEIDNKVKYFGDFDLAGLRIYESEFKRKLGDKISFIVPPDLEERIRRGGNPNLYSLHMNGGYADAGEKTQELHEVVSLLHSLQSGYEQEGYCRTLVASD